MADSFFLWKDVKNRRNALVPARQGLLTAQESTWQGDERKFDYEQFKRNS
jgi:hypothetical protein